MVTKLFERVTIDPAKSIVLMCGPEIMMRLGVPILLRQGIPATAMYVSLERHMEYGIGLCGHSMAAAAREAGVPIVTGDTKVVDRGKGDGIFINTAGIGLVPTGVCAAATDCAR